MCCELIYNVIIAPQDKQTMSFIGRGTLVLTGAIMIIKKGMIIKLVKSYPLQHEAADISAKHYWVAARGTGALRNSRS